MKETGESRGLGRRDVERIHSGTHLFSHTLQMQVAEGSTCCTRERRRSRRGEKGRLAGSQESRI